MAATTSSVGESGKSGVIDGRSSSSAMSMVEAATEPISIWKRAISRIASDTAYTRSCSGVARYCCCVCDSA